MKSIRDFFSRKSPRQANCSVLRLELLCRNQLVSELEPEVSIRLLSEFTERVARAVEKARGIAHAVDAGDYLVALPEDRTLNCGIEACRLAFKLQIEAAKILSTAGFDSHLSDPKGLHIAAGLSHGMILLASGALAIPILGVPATEAGSLLGWARRLQVGVLAHENCVALLGQQAVSHKLKLDASNFGWEIVALLPLD